MFAAAMWAQAPAGAAPAKAPAVKDQGEYDLTQAIQKEKDPAKQLDLLHQWEQKYPDSDFKGQRTVMEATAEQSIMMAAYGKTDPAVLDAGVKAAHDILDNLSKYFDAGVKPAAVTEDQWKQYQKTFALQANTVIGYAAMTKKEDAEAEAAFKKVLEMDPDSAQVSYWLGTVIYRQRKVERIPEALYEFARSVVVTGNEALPAANKKPAEDYLTKAYTSFHGSAAGLDDVKKAAMKSALMPADFTIESVTDIAKKEEGDAAAFAAAHPDIALWRQIRDALKAEGGAAYFSQIKDAAIPPAGQAGFTMFPAKVVSQPSPKELLVNVDNLAGDATLKFENPLKGTIEPGTAIKFKGVVESFVPDPYMLTLTADKEDVQGLPASAFAGAAAPARRRTPPRKK